MSTNISTNMSTNIDMPMIMLALAFAQSHAHIAHGAGPVQEPSRPSRGRRVAKQGE